MLASIAFAALMAASPLPKCQKDTIKIVRAWNIFNPLEQFVNGSTPGVRGHFRDRNFGWKWQIQGGATVDGDTGADGKRVVMTDCAAAYSTAYYSQFFPNYPEGSGCTLGYGLGGSAYTRFAVKIGPTGNIVEVYEGLGNVRSARGLCQWR